MKKTMVVVGLIVAGLVFVGATQSEWETITLDSGTLYHDGSSSGVSSIPVPSSGHARQALIQAQGGAIRITLFGETWLSGSTGFKLEDGQGFELISGHQVRAFGFVPDADEASGVSCWYNVEGRS